MKNILIAWYFAVTLTGYVGGATVIGPFETQDDCNNMRAWVSQRSHVSWCWYKRDH